MTNRLMTAPPKNREGAKNLSQGQKYLVEKPGFYNRRDCQGKSGRNML